AARRRRRRRHEPEEQVRLPPARLRSIPRHQRSRHRLYVRRRGVARRARGGPRPRADQRQGQRRAAARAALTTLQSGHTTWSGMPSEGSAEQVVAHVRSLIERGALRPGDRLPAERHLASQIGVSRPTVRAGLHALAAMGVVRARHGSGTFIPDGPPALAPEPLSFLAALHGFSRDEMYEARRVLEVGAAGLAAERATSDQLAVLADEVASLFALMHEPQAFVVHDVNFRRVVAASSGNPILAALIQLLSCL